MTALTVRARAEEDASLRPVPWRRMAWVTWRQHRIALADVAALPGACRLMQRHATARRTLENSWRSRTGAEPPVQEVSPKSLTCPEALRAVLSCHP